MSSIISKVFDFMAVYFDKIPLLNKIKGFRFMFSVIGMVVCYALGQYAVGDPEIVKALEVGFMGLAGLSLNAKGRE
jgi:hypothetical protein